MFELKPKVNFSVHGKKSSIKSMPSKKEYTIEELVELMQGLQSVQKHDITTQPAVQPTHGSGGLFSRSGVRPEMWSTLPRVRTLSGIVPFFKSEYGDQIHEILTGQLDSTGSNATDFCALGPVAGKLKVCQQITKFGEINISTEKIELPKVGLLKNRADTPRQLLNSGSIDNRFVPEVLNAFPADTRDLRAVILYRAGVQIERMIGLTEFAGVQGASSISGMQKEFRGVDGWVKTGYADAVENVACPAADSYVVNFNANIGNTMTDGRDIVEAVTDVYVTLNDRARQAGINATWVIAMHPYAFYALTDAWACNYVTSRCEFTGTNNNRLMVNGSELNQLRIDMLNGQYLLINGVPVPVVLCDGIDDGVQGSNNYQQDIYILPLTANNTPVLYYEYFDMGNPYANQFISQMDAFTYGVMNDGLYAMATYQTGGCISYSLYSMVRLMLDTPFLAGRVDNVTFKYLLGTRSPYPGRSLYADGGVSIIP